MLYGLFCLHDHFQDLLVGLQEWSLIFVIKRWIEWTSWKKRWFVLIEISLVFFRSDPNAAASQKGGEANLTLGGIDLNSSGRLACFYFIIFLHD
ncbi:putative PH-like domain superfamily protein [Helianthus annuus]|nr:putative PH-like domain superfamily protein [Helianthus annuus]